jgi:dephospho-CoA kinase
MIVVGLTGGIGSGKSTVSALLRDRGAVIVDADLIARQVVEPGGPAYQPVVDRFGPAILDEAGRLDRAALADVVFRDPDALKALESITHPAIQAEMARQMVAAGDGVVILDIPLLKERREHMQGIIVVDAPENVTVARLVEYRGFDAEDARRRIDAQISRAQRRALADVVIDNSGDEAQLQAEVDRIWAWVQTLGQ